MGYLSSDPLLENSYPIDVTLSGVRKGDNTVGEHCVYGGRREHSRDREIAGAGDGLEILLRVFDYPHFAV